MSRFHYLKTNLNSNHEIQNPQSAGPNKTSRHVHIRLLVFLQLADQVPLFLVSIGDDNVIYRWNVNTGQTTKWLELDSYAVDHDWMPFSKGASDVLAVGFVDGSIKLINKNGKVDKHITVETHKKSVISLKWSYDGGALATTGQDGSLKVWSKTGNLRTNLVQSDKPIYSVAWSPESDAVLYAFDKFIALKPISANQQKNLQWKAHEGLVLKVDWSPNNNSILSCG
jgi:intraflagellar transport protein 80